MIFIRNHKLLPTIAINNKGLVAYFNVGFAFADTPNLWIWQKKLKELADKSKDLSNFIIDK